MTDEINKYIVGVRQTRKTLQKGEAVEVYIALDADPDITDPIRGICNEDGIRVVEFNTMAELGKHCGIEIGASVACRCGQHISV